MIYVLARRYQDFLDFLRHENLYKPDFTYIQDKWAILGARGIRYIRIGQEHERPDFVEIMEELKQCGAKEITDIVKREITK